MFVFHCQLVVEFTTKNYLEYLLNNIVRTAMIFPLSSIIYALFKTEKEENAHQDNTDTLTISVSEVGFDGLL
jgi:hypothetical protein